MAPKEHRPILSWEKWVQEANPDEGKDAQVKEDTVRSSCHQDRPSQRESSRQRESSASRQREGATVRPREDRRHAESRPRDSSRRRQYSPERRQPAARLRPDDRHVMIVPKVVDINGVGRSAKPKHHGHIMCTSYVHHVHIICKAHIHSNSQHLFVPFEVWSGYCVPSTSLA